MKLKNKITLYSALLVVGLLLTAGVLIYPLGSRIRAKSSQLEKKQQKIAELQTRSEQLNSLRQTLAERKSDLERLNSLFINSEAPVDFLEFTEQTAADSNVDIDISPAIGQKANEFWSPTLFDIKATGSFEDCVRFLTKLEYAPYLIEFQSLELKERKEETEEKTREKTEINLSIKIY